MSCWDFVWNYFHWQNRAKWDNIVKVIGWTSLNINCLLNLISHLQTPSIIFKSCHSLQFITVSQSCIIINKLFYTAQRISYLHPVYTLFVITRGFVILHNSAMNTTPVFWAVRGFWLTLHSMNQHMSAMQSSMLQKPVSGNLWSSPERKHKYTDRVSRTGAPKNILIRLVAQVLLFLIVACSTFQSLKIQLKWSHCRAMLLLDM